MSRKGLKIKGDNCFPPITTLRFCQIFEIWTFSQNLQNQLEKSSVLKEKYGTFVRFFFFLSKSIVVCNAN